MPGVWMGGEMRFLRDYTGATLNAFTGQALYIGPTLYTRLGKKMFASATWNVQVWGGTPVIPGALDLTNFERHQAKVRLGFKF